MKYLAPIKLALASMLLTSCMNYTSDRIPPTRMNYNEALQYGDKQQLLLNIVRLRYNDLPYFFSVNNIIAQINYSNTFTGGANNTWTPPPVNFSTSGSDSVTVGEAPTITYTPLQGDAFIKKMLTPVDLRILFVMLHNSDADIGRILRIFGLELGPFDNASVHQGNKSPIPDLEFRKMATLLAKLVRCLQLDLTSSSINKQFAIKMTLKGFNQLPRKDQEILEKLGFSRTNPVVWLIQAKGGAPLSTHPVKSGGLMAAESNVGVQSREQSEAQSQQVTSFTAMEGSSKIAPIPTTLKLHPSTHAKPKKIVVLQTRTLFMVLTYLSKGVHVSPKEVNDSITSGSRLPNGNLLNWQFFTSEVFEVHVCKSRPKNAFLYVHYRGRWYYIRDDDLRAKMSFYIVTMLMMLYEGNVQNGLTPFFSIIA